MGRGVMLNAFSLLLYWMLNLTCHFVRKEKNKKLSYLQRLIILTMYDQTYKNLVQTHGHKALKTQLRLF